MKSTDEQKAAAQALLEPAAVEAYQHMPLQTQARVSVAISLKRIADAIEGQPGHTPPLEYLAECICRGLREGLQR